MRVCLVVLLAATGCMAAPSPGFWPQWRGPNRDNISRETGLLERWPPEGPPLAWSVQGVGKGTSSVAVRDGRVTVLGYVGEKEFVMALDEKTGRRLWSTSIGGAVEEHPAMRWFSNRTPTADGELLYAFRGDAKLVCLRAADGVEVWRKDYVSEYGTERHGFGHSDYPVVDGERLICSPCGEKATVVALEKTTGREIWRSRLSGKAQQPFGAVIVTEAAGSRHYVMQSRGAVFGVRPEDGVVLWTVPSPKDSDYLVSATPVAVGDAFIIASRWELPLRTIRLLPVPGGIAAEAVQSGKSPAAFQDDSMVRLDAHLYGVSSNGLFCLRANTGESVWSERWMSDMRSFTVSQGRLILFSTTSQVSLLEASPAGLKPLSGFFLPGPSRLTGAANPVVAGGRLYLRDEDRLFCYDLRPPAGRTGTLSAPVVLKRPEGAGEGPPSAVYVSTPADVVQKMMELVQPGGGALVYDLGSGDGRILIEAARRGGRAVGLEIDPELVALSEKKIAGEPRLRARIIVHQADLFTADLSRADVVAVYLPGSFLTRLLPQFERMKPGSRIVSHQFKIPGFVPDRTVEMASTEDPLPHSIYVWTVPLRKEGGPGKGSDR